MGDFFAFRRMITPVLIQIIYWVVTVVVVIVGFAGLVGGEGGGERLIGLGTLILGPLFVRCTRRFSL